MELVEATYNLLEEGRVREAWEEVDARRDTEEGTPAWDAAYGLLLFNQGDFDSSELHLKSSIERAPNDLVLKVYASSMVSAGRGQDLVQLLQDLGDRVETDTQQTIMFWIMSRERDLTEAQVHTMLSALPAEEWSGVLSSAGITAFDRFRFKYSKTLSRLAQSYGMANDWKQFFLIAVLAMHERRLEDAEAAIDEIEDRFEFVAEVPLLRGLLARERKQYDAAMNWFKECMESNPWWARPRREAAWTAVMTGRHDEAEELVAGLSPNSRRQYEAKAILAVSLFKRWKLAAGLKMMLSKHIV